MRKSVILFIAILFHVECMAAVTDTLQAGLIARSFMEQHRANGLRMAPGIQGERPVLAYQRNSEELNVPLYYVFNFSDGGHVIVAGTDASCAVLGYSEKNSFDEEAIPDNMRWWLDEYERQLTYAIKNGCRLESNVQAANIEPLIKSTWNQGDPYNALCPVGKNNVRCWTGCVATAMAQVMNYYRWPVKGVGKHQYVCYIDNDSLNAKPLSADFGNTYYDWSNMRKSYNSKTQNYNAAEKKAVSTLMYHCGVASDMKYGTVGSSASIAHALNALKEYFQYSRAGSYLGRDWNGVTDDIFQNTICEDLTNGRPVIYCGASSDGVSSHAFICDGVKPTGYYHFNWGWGGLYDGWFLLTSLTPSADDNFSYNQWILSHVSPYSGTRNKIVNVSKAGTLANLVSEEEFYNLDSLTVSGYINGDDILQIRKMCGRDENGKATEGRLKYLNLSGVKIVRGGGNYYEGNALVEDNVIPAYAFFACAQLQEVCVPNSVMSIGKQSFSYCTGLERINLSGGLETIENFAFWGCSGLLSVKLPTSLKNVGQAIFGECTNLKKVSVDANSEYFIVEDNVLFSRDMKTLAQDFVDDKEAYTIPSATMEIGTAAFRYVTKLKTLTIPQTVKSIRSGFLMDCSGLLDVFCLSQRPIQIGSYAIGAIIDATLHVPYGSKASYEAAGWDKFKTIVEDLPYSGDRNTTVFVRSSGTLAELLTEAEMENLDSLTVQGYINGDDLLLLRKMSGRDINGNATNGRLHYLNLSSVKLIHGGNYYDDYVMEENDIIPAYAFYKTKLKTILLPLSAKGIDTHAFDGCVSLTGVSVPGNVSFIGDSAFAGCSNLQEIKLEEGLEEIEPFAFNGCSSLTEVQLPASLSRVGQAIFVNCTNLQEVSVSSNSEYFKVENNMLFSYDMSTLVQELVDDKSTYVIPDMTTAIGATAFRYIAKLQELTIPATVKSFGNNFMLDCRGLRDVFSLSGNPVKIGAGAIPDTITSVTLHVPYGSKLLYEATNWNKFANIIEDLPYNGDRSKTVIAGKSGILAELLTEAEMENLDSLTIRGYINGDDLLLLRKMSGRDEEGKPTNGRLCYLDLSAVKLVKGGGCYYPGYALEEDNVIPAYAFCRTNLETIILPFSISGIEAHSFHSCKKLTEMCVPGNVKSIGNSAFYFCENLERVSLEEGLEEIKPFAFNGCSALTSVELPASLSTAGQAIFVNCTNLQEVSVNANSEYFKVEDNMLFSYDMSTQKQDLVDDKVTYVIPNTTTAIGATAFRYITKLQELTIPETVSSFGNNFILDCSGLRDVYNLSPNPVQIGAGVIRDTITYATLHVPFGCKAFYEETNWGKFANIVEDLPNGIYSPSNSDDYKVWDLFGHKSNGLRRGINIIWQDGKRRKVVKSW